ncbi:metallophosphoesterase domain-containing protein 1 [Tribolium castaneum]|uniref:Metallophosphoesterase domain-containing protein 1-like Protein n=1 Tax=Tribolium castaneum TaxID=7070 RepID=D6WGJ9_TRICA|nr:PREDICTED: metallophosphoesterase domain-containing protein 1 [Tribolium castaneum]EFA00573.1 Metallophosphoesterase domain-containing protein 1-like Protein [Tribolium castaneum]|eukprot:XP_971270.1 PREDICTED: metallophosphoesterase domain-containing protein 1 [Tribolium castaneum]
MENGTIPVHKLTSNPTAAWREISKNQKIIKLNVKSPSKPVEPNKVRFVCMSDTHSLIRNLVFDVPDGDVFIHAGDFTKCGQKEEVMQFNKWLVSLPHKHKIVISGNHELSFDKKFSDYFKKTASARHTGSLEDEVPNYGNTKDNISDAVNTDNIRQYLTNCTYLEDSGIDIYGIKLYGTPWQPEFGGWAFNLERGEECLSKWNLIPNDTDVLITHTPPLGFGDLVCSGVRAGCVELLTTVQQRVKPKYHVFGHIHEGYGVFSDGKIIYINASTCDINYIPKNLPIVFDVPLPEGQSKH